MKLMMSGSKNDQESSQEDHPAKNKVKMIEHKPNSDSQFNA